jgi:hypothetical protein
VRRFIAGFASIATFAPTFTSGRMRKFPFADNHFALDQDKNEIVSDRELAAFKQKQNDRK